MSLASLVVDPKFLALSPADQQATLGQVDAGFGKLSPADFQATLREAQHRAMSDPAVAATPIRAPQPQMHTSVLGDIYAGGGTPSGQSTNATGGTVIVPKPGESFQDTMGRAAASGQQYIDPSTNDLNPKGQQMVNTELSQGGAPGVAIGAGKGVLETAHTAAAAAGKVLPDSIDNEIGLPTSFKEPDYLQSTNGAQTAGKVAESIAEFMMGDAALKSLTLGEKIAQITKISNLAKSSPYAAKLLEIGMNAVRTGTVGGVQTLAHGGTPKEAAINAAVAGGASAAVEAAGAGLQALRPRSVPIANVDVPVRASIAEPGVVNKTAEMAANKTALQSFDALETQPAARQVISNLATAAKNETTGEMVKSLLGGEKPGATMMDTLNNYEAAYHSKSKAFDQIMELSKDTTPVKDFGDFATQLKARLQTYYQAADAASTTAGKQVATGVLDASGNPVMRTVEGEAGTSAFKLAQDAEKVAQDAHDSAKVLDAVNRQRVIFDKANGTGMYDKVRSLYTRLDALQRIGDKMNALAVVKNTPTDFLPAVLKQAGRNATDPGLIDGGALRRMVRELVADKEIVNGKTLNVFQRAGISVENVAKLQELGSLLERSQVQSKSLLNRVSGLKAAGASGAIAGAAELAISHAITAGTGGVLGVGAATGYAANRFLGYLMTHPDALNSTLQIARTLVPAVSVQASRAAQNPTK